LLFALNTIQEGWQSSTFSSSPTIVVVFPKSTARLLPRPNPKFIISLLLATGLSNINSKSYPSTKKVRHLLHESFSYQYPRLTTHGGAQKFLSLPSSARSYQRYGQYRSHPAAGQQGDLPTHTPGRSVLRPIISEGRFFSDFVVAYI